ncbi:hypothetical protein BU25DRAFT_426723 [Macroventuria anomochaeta]|uniref:Uncharacterized protein n=1 Tax=Macroventuria anomochaeta TaxID=301207 RepID=A0ACB6RI78_9PLEO|nr:uncharacterized protein BU25DRAFT_426723 [Macroventuria anomochaeta]KAF2621115.1 hypothetical protein BU25DRAFT_426723 [Macroventuria anomochaeta]
MTSSSVPLHLKTGMLEVVASCSLVYLEEVSNFRPMRVAGRQAQCFDVVGRRLWSMIELLSVVFVGVRVQKLSARSSGSSSHSRVRVLKTIDAVKALHSAPVHHFTALHVNPFVSIVSALAVDSGVTLEGSCGRPVVVYNDTVGAGSLGDPGAKINVPTASEKSARTKSRADDEQGLQEFGVRSKWTQNSPPELLKHFRKVVQRERGEKSPSARQLAKSYPSTPRVNESTVVGLVAPLLLFEDKLHRQFDSEYHIIRNNGISYDQRCSNKVYKAQRCSLITSVKNFRAYILFCLPERGA